MKIPGRGPWFASGVKNIDPKNPVKNPMLLITKTPGIIYRTGSGFTETCFFALFE